MKSLYLNIFGKHFRILRLKYLHKNFVLLKIIVVRVKNLRKNYYEKYKKKILSYLKIYNIENESKFVEIKKLRLKYN
jgi:hypothetical protein